MTEQLLFEEHPIQTIKAVRVATGISRTTILKACQHGPLRECSYESEDIWLIDTGSEQFAAWLAAHPLQRRVKGQRLKQTIQDAVWNRKVDQVSTNEVANRFECSLPTARKILMGIVTGTSGDERFKPNKDGGGVFISDGSTFNYSPMDVNGRGSSPKTPKHSTWFCS